MRGGREDRRRQLFEERIDLAGHHHAVFGESLGHRQRREPDKHADLEDALRLAHGAEGGQQLALDGVCRPIG